MGAPERSDLPAGTVTFLFTDVEGSTRLLHELGSEGYAAALWEHRRLLREAFGRHGGVEVDTEGDAFFVAFADPGDAVAAAAQAQEALASGPLRARMGLHTGSPHLSDQGYVGVDVHLGARIAASAHGGQVVLSKATRELLGEGFELFDLGEHRVKDFADPVWIYQVGAEHFPPLKTISNTNLPRPASSFVGREREVAEVAALLRDGARLVTLTGPGGTGKTRLAIEAASELVPSFKNGVFWVPLAALRDPALVTATIGQVIGAKDGLAEAIAEREMLLLVDNLEQVVDAAPELATVVEACPNLRLLGTSRELLRVRGETEYAVPPLADIEAVELFSERARLKPDEVIAELCRRLDDLPLAVELAAARASVLTPAQILERLSTRLDLLKGGRDAEARQATLRATIEWSYELLSPAEQSLFARLSTFRGGFTLEAAETIADADLDVLGALVDKSLLRRNDERFAMLETIREFAAERLEASGEADELPHRHADFFLGLAERAYAQRMASDTDWLAILDAEHDNIRAALDWTAGHDPRTHAGLAGACAFYWDSRGFASEALERLLGAASRYLVRDRIRARALTFLSIVGFRAHMAEAAGEAADAGQRIEQAIELWRALGDPRGEAMALEQRGLMRVAAGDVDAARRDLERSLALLREAGASELEQAVSLSGLCQLLVSIGDVTSAEPLARELEDLAHRAGSAELLSDALHYLADVPLLAGDFWEAQERYRRAVAHARAHGMRIQCTNDLLGLAMALAGQGQDARAVRLASAAYEQRVRLGIRRLSPMRFWRELQERHIGAARARLSSDQLEAAEREGGGADFETILDEVSAPETADDQA